MPEVSTFSTLRERAGLQPDDIAYAYTDYDSNWEGVTTRSLGARSAGAR